MNQMTVQDRSLISRFSSSILGRGKKISGHKILINSLFVLRSNTEKKVLTLYLQKKMFEKKCDNDLFTFLFSIGFTLKTIQGFIKYLQYLVLLENPKIFQRIQHNNIIAKEKDIKVQEKDYCNKENKEVADLKNLRLLKDSIKNIESNKYLLESFLTNNFKGISSFLPLAKPRSFSPKAMMFANQSFTSPPAKKTEHKMRFLKTFFAISKTLDVASGEELPFANLLLKSSILTTLPLASGESETKRNDNKDHVGLLPLANRQTNKLICNKSIDNVKPVLENRKVRKGRITYRVPLVTQPGRQEGRAIAWLIESASSRKNKTKHLQLLEKREDRFSLLSKMEDDKKKIFRSLQYCLAEELLDSYNKKGESMDRKKEFHKIALQNRAYTHYRWW